MLYETLKVIHILAVISWMAGLLYLPRIFVYHARVEPGGEISETFKKMERRLLKFIMNPAMLVSWIFGIAIAVKAGFLLDFWFILKLGCVVLLTVVHMKMAKHVRSFAQNTNKKSRTYFRFFNEIPTLLMVFIVILVVFKPFL